MSNGTIERAKYLNAKESLQLALFDGKIRFIRAIYEPNGKPELFKIEDPTIHVGDYLNVMSTARLNVTTVRVVEEDIDTDIDGNEVAYLTVQKIDFKPYFEALEREQRANALIRAAELRKKREDMRAALFANHDELMKTITGETADDKGLPPPPPATV